MSGAAERIRKSLNCVGVYRLTGESSADWEGNACAVALDALENRMDRALADVFIESAGSERLDVWERIFRPQGAEKIDDRRRTIAERLAQNPMGFTVGSATSMLAAAGVSGEIAEGNDGLTVLIGRFLLNRERAERELDEILPSHPAWVIDESVNWIALDAWAAEFDRLDSRGLTWEKIDTMTREELEKIDEEEN